MFSKFYMPRFEVLKSLEIIYYLSPSKYCKDRFKPIGEQIRVKEKLHFQNKSIKREIYNIIRSEMLGKGHEQII